MKRTLLVITLVGFSAVTAAAIWNHGVWGIIEPLIRSFGGAQVFVDLVIALTLFLVWMWRDAKANGRNPWPWILLTLASGSFGPLIYLIVYTPGSTTRKTA